MALYKRGLRYFRFCVNAEFSLSETDQVMREEAVQYKCGFKLLGVSSLGSYTIFAFNNFVVCRVDQYILKATLFM